MTVWIFFIDDDVDDGGCCLLLILAWILGVLIQLGMGLFLLVTKPGTPEMFDAFGPFHAISMFIIAGWFVRTVIAMIFGNLGELFKSSPATTERVLQRSTRFLAASGMTYLVFRTGQMLMEGGAKYFGQVWYDFPIFLLAMLVMGVVVNAVFFVLRGAAR